MRFQSRTVKEGAGCGNVEEVHLAELVMFWNGWGLVMRGEWLWDPPWGALNVHGGPFISSLKSPRGQSLFCFVLFL